MPFGQYPRCDRCSHKVPQVDEKVIKGKRIRLCPSCARKAGWYDPERKEDEQGKLF
jgi:formylmethanofuran dehydrogenase subunit E